MYQPTHEQLQAFEENGYLKLQGCISQELLHRLQIESGNWIDESLSSSLAGRPIDNHAIVTGNNNKQHLIRINNLHKVGYRTTFELLIHPVLCTAVESICGKNVITEYESLLIKENGDNQNIPWHQDVVYQREYRVLTAGIYLDDSTINNGCLKVLPGTQHLKQDICSITKKHGYESPEIHNVVANAGDIILHDAMIVHASAESTSGSRRRTIYFEFRSVEHVEAEGYRPATWINGRKRIQELADSYTCNNPFNTEEHHHVIEQVLCTIYADRLPGKPGNFCLGGNNENIN